MKRVVMGVVAALVTACSTGTAAPAPVASHPLPRDPHTAAALIRIATAFNNDYDTGLYGPVYDRWDMRSKAIISRADYIRRHTECPSVATTAHVEAAQPGPDGAWLVRYEIGGAQFTDYWFYIDGRWVFDLELSNPSAVRLYKLSAEQYVKELGCSE